MQQTCVWIYSSPRPRSDSTFGTHGWGGGCLSAVSHPGWQMLFLQPAVSFLQTAPLSGHRLWPRNSNSLKCVKGSDPGAPACSFLPSINGEKRRSHKMLFSFFPPFEELHKLSGAVLFFVGSYITWPNQEEY